MAFLWEFGNNNNNNNNEKKKKKKMKTKKKNLQYHRVFQIHLHINNHILNITVE